MKAWSYSALTAFETCPRRFYETRVAKKFVEAEGVALVMGSAAHKVLELRAKTGAPIPKTLTITTAAGDTASESTAGWEPMMQKLLEVKGETLTEYQIALTEDFKPTGWFDKDVWVRGVIDFAKKGANKVLAIDYKTGKRKPDNDQLMLFAGLIMEVWPEIEIVDTGFLWLKTKEVDRSRFNRNNKQSIWDNFLPRVKRMECAYDTDTWDAKRSGLCRNWCPVASCKFHGQQQRPPC